MNERKEQATFFERALIEDPTYAETVFEDESNRFKIKLMLIAFVAVVTLVFYVVQIVVAGSSFGTTVLLMAPLAYALYNLYQSYVNMKDARDFLEACRMVHI